MVRGMNNIKVLNSQKAKCVGNLQKSQTKIQKTNASIWYNKQRKALELTSKYVKKHSAVHYSWYIKG